MKNINKTANTAMLAGEILLISGTEIFRIEDTMDRILDTAPSAKHNVMASVLLSQTQREWLL